MNPFDPPNLEQLTSGRNWSFGLSYLLSILSFGTIVGVSFLFIITALFVLPFWGPPIYKGDDRWKTIFYLASTGLPLSIVAGVALVAGLLALFRKRLTLGQMLFCWFMSVALIPSFRPVVDRIRRPGNTPLYESVPDTIWYIALGFFVITLVAAVGVNRKPKPLDEPSDAPKSPVGHEFES